MPNELKYATEYSKALAQAYAYALYFGALYSTPNNNRYRWVNARTIEIPSITTTGRVNGNRDTIALAQRNFDNSWEPKTLRNYRKWSTLVDPKDIDETNMAATITNITQAYNEQQKFPEMDAYTVSKLYADWTTSVTEQGYTGHTADTTVLTEANVLSVFDDLMLNMDDARVPPTGRILYVTNQVNKLIKNANNIIRQFGVQDSRDSINRRVNRLDEVTIVPVPSTLMKTKYDFTEGWKQVEGSQQINMMLVDPNAVITPEKYSAVRLDPPSAMSENKWVYYEESYGDVFILNKKADGLQFNVTAAKKQEGGTTDGES